MFNKNGSNNGTGNGVVHANGNGHKPDAAIPAEHDLLWDGLSPAVQARRSDSPSTRRWPPSARAAPGGATTTSKATSSSSRPTASSDTAVGATSWSATSPCAGPRRSTPRPAR